MSKCTDENLGLLLHDYELGLLSDNDRNRFELHLYECDYCIAQVRKFIYVSRLILIDPNFKKLAADGAEETCDIIKSSTNNNYSKIVKYLIAAAIVVILAIPAHRYWRQSDKPSIVQTLKLLPTRAGGSDVIYLDKGGNVEINFIITDKVEGEMDLIIAGIAGDTVVCLRDFADYSTNGLGAITLPVSSFTEGHYMLRIKTKYNSGIEELIYMFRVK